MRITNWVLAAAATAMVATGGTGNLKVQICMVVGVVYNPGINFAQGVADHIFQDAGVDLEWASSRHCRPDAIRVKLQANTPSNEHPGAYAYAMPYEGHTIVVLYDRIVAGNSEAIVYPILGHVLAHEIGHILEGVARHSESGTLKPVFTLQDRCAMIKHALGFAEEDVRLIHDGIERRNRAYSGGM